MTLLREIVDDALADFERVAELARSPCAASTIEVQIADPPHRQPASLPTGKMAVYAFFHDGQALKVGKAGAKSAARYTSQHYNPNSAMSTLARSILTNPAKLGVAALDDAAVGGWIRENTARVNLLIPASLGLPILSLLETFLHVRWKPRFEGPSVAE